MDWECLNAFASQQAVSAIVFNGLERLGGDVVNVPRDLLFSRIAENEQIKRRNLLLNNRCFELVKQLQNDGFQCCILKGHGNAVSVKKRRIAGAE